MQVAVQPRCWFELRVKMVINHIWFAEQALAAGFDRILKLTTSVTSVMVRVKHAKHDSS